jgi:hypothetical protein
MPVDTRSGTLEWCWLLGQVPQGAGQQGAVVWDTIWLGPASSLLSNLPP